MQALPAPWLILYQGILLVVRTTAVNRVNYVALPLSGMLVHTRYMHRSVRNCKDRLGSK